MRGFTLLELLLVMAIMATLTAVLVPNLRGFNASQKLVDAAGQLQSDLRQVQNNATAGLKCSTNTAVNWSLELTRDVGTNTIRNYNIGASCLNGEAYPAKAYSLPAGTWISQIDLDACSVTNVVEMNQFKVFYGNITGRTSFTHNVVSCGASVNPQQVTLHLKTDSDPSLVNKVILNTGGAIYAQ